MHTNLSLIPVIMYDFQSPRDVLRSVHSDVACKYLWKDKTINLAVRSITCLVEIQVTETQVSGAWMIFGCFI